MVGNSITTMAKAQDWYESAAYQEVLPIRLRANRDEKAPIRRVIWAAEIESGHWVLVRAEMETLYGTVVGRLLSGVELESDLQTSPIQ